VVLGCTHYSLIKGWIADFYGAEVLDGNEAVAKRLGQVLAQRAKSSTDGEKKPPYAVCFCASKKSLRNLPFFVEKRREKSRRFSLKKEACFWEVKNAESLYFLGSGRVFNRQFYERMFEFQQYSKQKWSIFPKF
jgi:hypothetical protein